MLKYRRYAYYVLKPDVLGKRSCESLLGFLGRVDEPQLLRFEGSCMIECFTQEDDKLLNDLYDMFQRVGIDVK